MTQLLYFYYGGHPDHRGRTLAEILRQDNHWLEYTHDYIQWLFPLETPSLANRNAPLLTRRDIQTFHEDQLLRRHMTASFHRMLNFFGLEWSGDSVEKGENWAMRRREWFDVDTHNSLRISRMIESMYMLSLGQCAGAFASEVLTLCEEESQCGISAKSQGIWLSLHSKYGA